MMWLWYAVVFVASLVVSYSMMPKPQNRKPADLQEVKLPTAEVGRTIPVVFGDRVISGPNICWYGDFSTEEIRKG